MRANKLETALSRDCLACLAPPDMFFHVECTLVGMSDFGGFTTPGPTRDWDLPSLLLGAWQALRR